MTDDFMERLRKVCAEVEYDDDLECWVVYAPCGCGGGEEMYAGGTAGEAILRAMMDMPDGVD